MSDQTQRAVEQANVRGQRYMTSDELGALLRTPTETVRYWRQIGNGPKSFKVGRRVLYAVEDVETWLSEARAGAA